MYKTFRLLAAHLRKSIPDISWIDRDKGQLDNPTKFNSITIPGVLLNFASVSWKGETRGNQIGEGSVTVKLVLRLPVASFEGSKQNEFEQYETLPDDIYNAMSAHKSVGVRRASSDYFTAEFYVHEQTFDLILYETKTVKTILKPAPEIEGTLSTTLTIQS